MVPICGKAKRKANGGSMNDDVTLQCRFKTASSTLIEIRYVVSNRSKHDIYLFTPLSGYKGNEFVPAPDRVYVDLASNGLATFSKRLWKVPEMIDVYMPEVPFLTRVAAGTNFQETIQVGVPVIINFPYRDAYDPGNKALPSRSSMTSATFVIGYVQQDEDVKLNEAPRGSGLFTISYGQGITRQKLLASESFALTAPVVVP
jgi:hypothetical protein